MAVEKSLENPLCRGVQGGSNHWPMTLVQHKLATEQRRAIEVVVRGNGHGRPGGRHEFLSVSRAEIARCCVEG